MNRLLSVGIPRVVSRVLDHCVSSGRVCARTPGEPYWKLVFADIKYDTRQLGIMSTESKALATEGSRKLEDDDGVC